MRNKFQAHQQQHYLYQKHTNSTIMSVKKPPTGINSRKRNWPERNDFPLRHSIKISCDFKGHLLLRLTLTTDLNSLPNRAYST